MHQVATELRALDDQQVLHQRDRVSRLHTSLWFEFSNLFMLSLFEVPQCPKEFHAFRLRLTSSNVGS